MPRFNIVFTDTEDRVLSFLSVALNISKAEVLRRGLGLLKECYEHPGEDPRVAIWTAPRWGGHHNA